MFPIYSIKFENQAFELPVHPPPPDANTAECKGGNSDNAEHCDTEREPKIHQPQSGGDASKQTYQHDQFSKLDFLCSSILRLFRNLLSTSKRRIFQVPQDGLFHYLEKISARSFKNQSFSPDSRYPNQNVRNFPDVIVLIDSLSSC